MNQSTSKGKKMSWSNCNIFFKDIPVASDDPDPKYGESKDGSSATGFIIDGWKDSHFDEMTNSGIGVLLNIEALIGEPVRFRFHVSGSPLVRFEISDTSLRHLHNALTTILAMNEIDSNP